MQRFAGGAIAEELRQRGQPVDEIAYQQNIKGVHLATVANSAISPEGKAGSNPAMTSTTPNMNIPQAMPDDKGEGMLFSTFSPKEEPRPGQRGWGNGDMSLRAEEAISEGLSSIVRCLACHAARLTFTHRRFAPEWLLLHRRYPELRAREWKHWWAVTETDRLRLRVEIDALCADLYGLNPDDFDWIVRNDPTDPKGFWRVDKQLPYEQRLTGLAARAFRTLKEVKWSAETVGDLTNDYFFELLGIPELTSESAAKKKGYDRPLIYNRDGCHRWQPELFAEDDPRHGYTWADCHRDAVAILGSVKAVDDYVMGKFEQNTEAQVEPITRQGILL